MKLKQIILMLMLMLVLQSCGSGDTDTMGVLTLTKPAISGGTTLGTTASVSFTVTYTPPAGKVPNGTVIKTQILNGGGIVVSEYDTQLYSNTSYSDGFAVISTATEQLYTIRLSIGTMTAGSLVIIPVGT